MRPTKDRVYNLFFWFYKSGGQVAAFLDVGLAVKWSSKKDYSLKIINLSDIWITTYQKEINKTCLFFPWEHIRLYINFYPLTAHTLTLQTHHTSLAIFCLWIDSELQEGSE